MWHQFALSAVFFTIGLIVLYGFKINNDGKALLGNNIANFFLRLFIGAIASIVIALAMQYPWVIWVGMLALAFLSNYWMAFLNKKQSGGSKMYLLIAGSSYHVFGGALWILPLLTLGGAVWFYHIAHKAHLSNSTQQVYDPTTDRYITKDNTGNVPLHSIGQFWFAVLTAWFLLQAAFSKAVADTLNHHFDTSVFKKLNARFWNPAVSSTAAKFLPFTKFRWDAWHIANTLMIDSFIASIAVQLPFVWYYKLAGFLASGLIFIVDFNEFYNHILRRNAKTLAIILCFCLSSCSFKEAPQLRYDYGELKSVDTIRHYNFPWEYIGQFEDSKKILWPICIPDSLRPAFIIGKFYVITPPR
jgi:hypothetical protein